MKEFPLWGRTFVVSDGRERYVELVKSFNEAGLLYCEKFCEEYQKKCRDMDAAIKYAVDLGAGFIATAIEELCLKLIVSEGIYTYNLEKFFNEYYVDKYCVYDQYYERIADKYAEIVLTQEQAHQYREARKDSRGRWQGGGFGVKGAVKGAATAGAMNLASGAAHSIFNSIGNLATDSAANRKKNALFKDKNTLETLCMGLYESISNMANAMLDFYEQNTDVVFERVTDEQIEEAKIMFDNLKKYDLDEKAKRDLLFQILSLNPFDPKVYVYIVNQMGDLKNRIEDLSDVFQCYDDVIREKARILKQEFGKINLEDEDSILKGRKRFERQAKRIGFFPDDKIILSYNAKLDQAWQKIDLEKRTINGVVYDTRELAEAERKRQADEERKFVESVGLYDFDFSDKSADNVVTLRRMLFELEKKAPVHISSEAEANIKKYFKSIGDEIETDFKVINWVPQDFTVSQFLLMQKYDSQYFYNFVMGRPNMWVLGDYDFECQTMEDESERLDGYGGHYPSKKTKTILRENGAKILLYFDCSLMKKGKKGIAVTTQYFWKLKALERIAIKDIKKIEIRESTENVGLSLSDGEKEIIVWDKDLGLESSDDSMQRFINQLKILFVRYLSNAYLWDARMQIPCPAQTGGTVNVKAEPEKKEDMHQKQDFKASSEVKNQMSESMFCPFCGNRIKRVVRFCNYCGKPNNYGR